MTYCCEVFPKIAKRFSWWGTRAFHAPIIVHEEHAFPILFCPSCGADIRGIVISKEEFDKLK